MSINDELRLKCKELKCFNNISYKVLAEMIDIKASSMYNFMRGTFNLSEEKATKGYETLTNVR